MCVFLSMDLQNGRPSESMTQDSQMLVRRCRDVAPSVALLEGGGRLGVGERKFFEGYLGIC